MRAIENPDGTTTWVHPVTGAKTMNPGRAMEWAEEAAGAPKTSHSPEASVLAVLSWTDLFRLLIRDIQHSQSVCAIAATSEALSGEVREAAKHAERSFAPLNLSLERLRSALLASGPVSTRNAEPYVVALRDLIRAVPEGVGGDAMDRAKELVFREWGARERDSEETS